MLHCIILYYRGQHGNNILKIAFCWNCGCRVEKLLYWRISLWKKKKTNSLVSSGRFYEYLIYVHHYRFACFSHGHWSEHTDNFMVYNLTELTDEMEKQVDNALRKNPPNEVLSEGFRLKITRHDMETLRSLNWLNDEVGRRSKCDLWYRHKIFFLISPDKIPEIGKTLPLSMNFLLFSSDEYDFRSFCSKLLTCLVAHLFSCHRKCCVTVKPLI